MAYAAIAIAAVMAAKKINEGYQQADQYEAAATSARNNAAATRQQANANEETQRRRNAMKLGEDRATMAQSGFDPSSGSALSLQAQNAGELELEALTTRYEGALKGMSYENEAARYKASAKSSRASAWINGATSFASSYFGGTGGASMMGGS